MSDKLAKHDEITLDVATVTLTSGEILAASTGYIQVVPAPGPDEMIVPLFDVMTSRVGASFYVLPNGWFLVYGDQSPDLLLLSGAAGTLGNPPPITSLGYYPSGLTGIPSKFAGLGLFATAPGITDGDFGVVYSVGYAVAPVGA